MREQRERRFLLCRTAQHVVSLERGGALLHDAGDHVMRHLLVVESRVARENDPSVTKIDNYALMSCGMA